MKRNIDRGSRALTTACCSRPPKASNGQILAGSLGFVLVLSVLFVMIYNTGRLSNEKIKLYNAADAAAYSSAALTARRMNFIAYTNRIMVANHVAVGHVVSYISFMRYFGNVSNNNPGVFGAPALPIVFLMGPIFSGWSTAPQWANNLSIPNAVDMAAAYINNVNNMNQTYFAAQVANYDQAGASAQTLMEDIVRSYDDEIRVNNENDFQIALDLAFTLGEFGLYNALLDAENQSSTIQDFMEQTNAVDDSERMRKFVDDSVTNLRQGSNVWYSARGWGPRNVERLENGVLVPHVVRKEGVTTQVVTAQGLDWQANDQVFEDDVVVDTGSATASEFDALTALPYTGIPGYVRLRDADGATIEPLPISAFVVLNMDDKRWGYPGVIKGRGLGGGSLIGAEGVNDNPIEISAFASATVFYQRPSVGFNALQSPYGETEYANLFNPFWQSRLSY